MAEKAPHTMAAASGREEQTGLEQLSGARPEAVDGGQQRGIPSLDLNLWQHKAPIAITFSVLIMTSGILPIALYLGLVHAGIESTIPIAIPAAIFGAPSLLTLLKRSYSLLRRKSITRPIGAKWYHLDFFHINFLMNFTLITGMLVTSNVLAEDHPLIALRLFSMPLSIIILSTCLQTTLTRLAMAVTRNDALRYPCRVSSMGRGDVVRGASYTIVEDIVAVDGKQGTMFRKRWDARYTASKEIRSLLRWSDAVWGVSGSVLSVALIVIIWVVDEVNVIVVLGWALPWAWAGVLTLVTIRRVQSVLARERANFWGDPLFEQ